MTIKYLHKQIVSILIVAVTAFFLPTPANGNGGQTDPVEKTVQHLIAYVARSDLTFIRNSRQYSANEASGHMQKKYEHFRDKIKTPEDFIELCATRSVLSGKPYLVINERAKKIRTGEWLLVELEEYRNDATSESQ